jgi:hypothetical protein
MKVQCFLQIPDNCRMLAWLLLVTYIPSIIDHDFQVSHMVLEEQNSCSFPCMTLSAVIPLFFFGTCLVRWQSLLVGPRALSDRVQDALSLLFLLLLLPPDLSPHHFLLSPVRRIPWSSPSIWRRRPSSKRKLATRLASPHLMVLDSSVSRPSILNFPQWPKHTPSPMVKRNPSTLQHRTLSLSEPRVPLRLHRIPNSTPSVLCKPRRALPPTLRKPRRDL